MTSSRVTLHLVRNGALPMLGDHDWRVDLGADGLVLVAGQGTPPLRPGPVTYDQLIELIAAANRVITW